MPTPLRRLAIPLSVVLALFAVPPVATASTAPSAQTTTSTAASTSTTTTPRPAPTQRRGIEWGPTTWVGGVGGYAVSGRLKGPSRQVRLEYKVPGDWRTLDKARSRKRSFSLAGPWEWYGAHQVRLRAMPAKGRPAKVLGKQTFTVTPDYVPRGDASQFTNFTFDDRIYRFNPCRTIRWRFNSGGGVGDPLFGQVQTAITLLSRATGMEFKYVGTSTSVPLNVTKLEKRTDLVVAFSHDADTPKMEGATARGGPVQLTRRPAKGPGPKSYRTISAGVTISIETLLSSGYYSFDEVSSMPTAMLVFLHELGHAMGLDHVTTPGSDVEVMFSGSTYIAPWADGLNYPRWGAGDLAGLSRVGLASGCLR